MRLIWSRDRQEFIPPEQFYAEKFATTQRSGLPAPMVVNDTMAETLNHADGKHYTSKSAFTQAVRAAGCEIVGNDPAIKRVANREYKAEGIVDDIKQAIATTGS
jgi:hypothetical protein